MKKILLVDDEQEFRELVSKRLTFNGYAVETANDGEEALVKFKAELPNLVILDLGLPKLDGYVVAERMKRHAENVPIIILTARGGELEKEIGLLAGAAAYMLKPFEPEKLLAKIKELIGL